MPTDANVTNNAARRRYEAVVDETSAGFVDYQETDELIILTHIEVTRRSRAGEGTVRPG